MTMTVVRRSQALGSVSLVLLLGFAVLLAPLRGSAADEFGQEDPMEMDLSQLANLDLYLNAMGVTGIHHTHVGGEWMVGYQTKYMSMRGNLDGTKNQSTGDVLATHMVAPRKMSMEMHMIDIMYAANDDLTFMFMVPFKRVSMDHVTRTGVQFTTDSAGIGDIKLSALYSLWRQDYEGRTDRVVMNLGGSLPTGSINEKDDTPMGKVTLPYPMQLGSGTADFRPGLTYLGQTDLWSWGSHLGGTFRFTDNRKDYQLGNQGELGLWLSRGFTSWLSASLRLRGEIWGDINGADDRFNPAMVPTADPNLRGGRRIDALLGTNIFALSGPLAGNRLALEFGVPVYQSLNGPQLKTEWYMSLTWNWTFGG